MAERIAFPSAQALAECRAQVAARDRVVEELTRLLEAEREKSARYRGVNDLLRLQLADLLASVRAWRGQFDLVERNLTELRNKLPQGD